MKQLMKVFLLVAIFSTAGAKAEYYDYSSSWGGMYNTGGYNLYNFGTDMNNLGGYYNSGYGSYGGYSDQNWGGSCASFSPCQGGYDYSNLYGAGYYSGNSWDILININIPIYAYGNYGGCNSCGGYTGCGMCQPSPCSYSPSSCGSTPSYPNYPTYPNYPSYPTYPTWPTYPTDPIPPVVIDITPPTLPPWGGCGNYVQCPGGPVTPPSQPPSPTYNWTEDTSPTNPVRYKVPRGVHGAN